MAAPSVPDPSADDGWRLRYPAEAASRRAKAQKILHVLSGHVVIEGARVLELGVGSGHMTRVFLDAVGTDGQVVGADVVDMRAETAGNVFHLIEGTDLPFEPGGFDVVISNHVIEHVGDHEDQGAHLRSIRSVMAPSGICYLATPSRWAPIEPHFKLPLAGWLPRRARTPYVRVTGRSNCFDVEPLSPRDLDLLVAGAGFAAVDVTADAMRALAVTEPDHWAAGPVGRVPPSIDPFVARLMPTQVRLLRPVDDGPATR